MKDLVRSHSNRESSESVQVVCRREFVNTAFVFAMGVAGQRCAESPKPLVSISPPNPDNSPRVRHIRLSPESRSLTIRPSSEVLLLGVESIPIPLCNSACNDFVLLRGEGT